MNCSLSICACVRQQRQTGLATYFGSVPLFLLLSSSLLSIIGIATMVSFTTVLLAFPIIIVQSLVILNTPSLTQPGSNATNTTSSNPFFQCNGEKFGYNLDWRSCTEALSQIDATSTAEQTYGPRLKGPFDVKLPQRYISCSISPPSYPSCLYRLRSMIK